MPGTPPPPPPPGGSPDKDPGASAQARRPDTGPTPGQRAPVQRVSTSTRVPPAISPASQFSQAVTPAPAAPGAPMVQSVHKGGGGSGLQQYFPEQYQQGYDPQGGPYPPQAYPAQTYPAQGYDQYSHATYSPEPDAYSPEPRRKKLSPAWIAFIALDVLLVVAAIVFAVSLISTPDGSPSNSGTTAAEQPAEPGTEQGLETDGGPEVETFASPTLNITCTVSADAATCGIAQLTDEPTVDAGCEGTSGYLARVDASGNVTQPCVAAEDQPTAAAADISVLDYGTTRKAHGFTCSSANTGMECVADATGAGFTIARAGIAQT